jgi:phenylpropionate dioxygenase-like ring-hydroxylating dioxygenase large terminal subunit
MMTGNPLAELRAALLHSEEVGFNSAWTMPANFYTDPTVLELELRNLFGKEWICIGRIEEVARPGDYMAFQLFNEPLIAVRDADARVHVLSNVCRHRGTQLATGSGNTQLLVCPYHHWSYDLCGRLKAAPRLDTHESFTKSACRLPEFACEEWHGFLFTSLAAEPPPLAPRLAPLDLRIRNYHMEQMSLRYLASEVWHTNWKCFIENFMEGYHLSPLHRTTLHAVNPTRLCTHYEAGDAYFGYNAGYAPELPRSNKGHPDLTAAQAGNCVMFAIPPGLVSGCGGDYSSFICVQPETVDRVRVKMGLIFYGDAWAQTDVDRAVQLFAATMAEDKAVLVNLMRGMGSARHQVGPLAPVDFEGPVLDFYRYCNRRLGDAIASRMP